MSNNTKDQTNVYVQEIYNKSNKLIEKFLLSYFIFGVAISLFYDTYLIAFLIGGLIIGAYYISKLMFKDAVINQYVASAGFAIFMAQFIYQMHGMFEMHFFAFIGAAIMITYHNCKNIIPLALIIAVHHILFAYLQMSGNDEIYFSQVTWDLQTLVMHIGLAVVIFFICGIWAYELNKRTKNNTINLIQMEQMTNVMMANMQFADDLAEGNLNSTLDSDQQDPLGQSLMKIKKELLGKG